MSRLLLAFMTLAWLSLVIAPVMAEDFTESDYRDAGAPACFAELICVVGYLIENEPGRLKVYVATQPALNGRELVLGESVPDAARLAGSVVVVSFTGVEGKAAVDGRILGLALPPARVSEDQASTSDQEAPPQPITSIDLTHWKLTLPIGEEDDPESAAEVVDLVGITLPPHFIVQPNSITFSAGVDGATTSGSSYPRSELREMDGSGDEYEWTLEQGGTLSATLAVIEVPTRTALNGGAAPAPIPLSVPGFGRVVIGQIHGPDDELCRLYFDNGVLYFNNDKAGASGKQESFPLKDEAGNLTSIALGESFSYTIAADTSRVTVTALADGKTFTASDTISSFWAGKALYFKAGVYVQVSIGGREIGTGTGTATFASIELKH